MPRESSIPFCTKIVDSNVVFPRLLSMFFTSFIILSCYTLDVPTQLVH